MIIKANINKKIRRWGSDFKYSFIPGVINLLDVNPTEWPNKLKQSISNLPTNCLSVFEHFVRLARKGLINKNLTFTALVVIIYNISDFASGYEDFKLNFKIHLG